MLIGRECASPAIIGSREIERRRSEFGIDPIDALAYPEQIKVARLLCSPRFLCAATDPDADAALRSSLVAKEVEKIIPTRDDGESWRATNRVWTAITHLTARRRDARIYGVPMRDTPSAWHVPHLRGRDGATHRRDSRGLDSERWISITGGARCAGIGSMPSGARPRPSFLSRPRIHGLVERPAPVLIRYAPLFPIAGPPPGAPSWSIRGVHRGAGFARARLTGMHAPPAP